MIRVLAVLLLQLVGCGDKDDSGVPDTDEPQVECDLLNTQCTEEQYSTHACDEGCDRVAFCDGNPWDSSDDEHYYWINTGYPCECLTEDGEIDHAHCPENDCY